MGSIENTNMGDARFQGLLESYLRLHSRQESLQDLSDHLDEDTLTAFTEGNLTMREADPLVSHLSDCSFCRHKTSELVRLDLALAETEGAAAVAKTPEPAKVSDVLNGILSRLFDGGEAAVFAHEEKKEDGCENDDKVKAEDKDKQ
jgi:hypothetical protein